jgi:hypothetical protein
VTEPVNTLVKTDTEPLDQLLRMLDEGAGRAARTREWANLVWMGLTLIGQYAFSSSHPLWWWGLLICLLTWGYGITGFVLAYRHMKQVDRQLLVRVRDLPAPEREVALARLTENASDDARRFLEPVLRDLKAGGELLPAGMPGNGREAAPGDG